MISSLGVGCFIPAITYISRKLALNRASLAPNLPLFILVGRLSGRFARWIGGGVRVIGFALRYPS